MKILNLYAGIGGNRKNWPDNVKVTAVELNPKIAEFYKKQFPNDNVIVGDAHDFLLHNYQDFDFIWSSSPCQSHSRARFWNSKGGNTKPRYPDMGLYQEIIFLQSYHNGRWAVENVKPYYEPLIRPTARLGRHLFWANFEIACLKKFEIAFPKDDYEQLQELTGFDLSGQYFDVRTNQILRNCVNPDLGLHVFNESKRIGMFQF